MPSFHVSHRSCLASVVLRESSFNMTGGDEDIEGGGGPKIFRHPKGGLGKFVYLKTNRREGGGT